MLNFFGTTKVITKKDQNGRFIAEFTFNSQVTQIWPRNDAKLVNNEG